MTCIASWIAPDKSIYMGADSAGTNVYFNQTIRVDQKLGTYRDMLMGFCGSYRMGQLLAHGLSVAAQNEGEDDYTYMVTSFIAGVRGTFRAGGWLHSKDGVETGGTFLVARRGRLFQVASDFQVGEGVENYAAVGSGADFALGAFYADKDDDTLQPVQRVIRALKAAENFNAAVRRPFFLRSVSPDGKFTTHNTEEYL